MCGLLMSVGIFPGLCFALVFSPMLNWCLRQVPERRCRPFTAGIIPVSSSPFVCQYIYLMGVCVFCFLCFLILFSLLCFAGVACTFFFLSVGVQILVFVMSRSVSYTIGLCDTYV